MGNLVGYARGDDSEPTSTRKTMNDEKIEQLINEKGANVAPRITPADLEAEIASEHYYTAGEALAEAVDAAASDCPQALKLLTHCVLVLRNGFTVTGESACASPENFNQEVGRKVARAKAIENLWPLLGFRLCDRLAQSDDGAVSGTSGAQEVRSVFQPSSDSAPESPIPTGRA